MKLKSVPRGRKEKKKKTYIDINIFLSVAVSIVLMRNVCPIKIIVSLLWGWAAYSLREQELLLLRFLPQFKITSLSFGKLKTHFSFFNASWFIILNQKVIEKHTWTRKGWTSNYLPYLLEDIQFSTSVLRIIGKKINK